MGAKEELVSPRAAAHSRTCKDIGYARGRVGTVGVVSNVTRKDVTRVGTDDPAVAVVHSCTSNLLSSSTGLLEGGVQDSPFPPLKLPRWLALFLSLNCCHTVQNRRYYTAVDRTNGRPRGNMRGHLK